MPHKRSVTGRLSRRDEAAWTGAQIVWDGVPIHFFGENFEACAITDSQGNFSIELWCDQTYTCLMPDGDRFVFSVPIGSSTIQLSKLRGDDGLVSRQLQDAMAYVDDQIATASIATANNKLALTKLAGRNLSAHRFVTIDDNDLIIYADNTIEAHAAGITGLTATAANKGDPVAIVSYGEVSDDSWTWTEQKPIFLSTEGELTQSVPAIGFVLQVAKALTPQKIFVSIKAPYLRMP